METIINYGIIALDFINKNFYIILSIIYGILAFNYHYKYYKEMKKNIRLRSKIKAAGFVLSITSKIIVDLLKDNKQTKIYLKSARKSRHNYQTKMAKYKKCFYAYDYARRTHFGNSAAGKVFYKSYTNATKKTMKFLNKDFRNSRKNLK